MIPKKFHQIWLGPNPLPKEFEKYQKTWKKFHPGWEFLFWTEENLPEDLDRIEIYEKLRSPVERSDLLRLEVVNKLGGIYIDTDFECIRSVEPLIADIDFFLAYLNENRTNNAIIGSVPGHPFLERAIKNATPRDFFGYDKAAAGPFYIDALIKEYPELKKFESYLFYPVTPYERGRAVAIHHASRTWRTDDGFRSAALFAEQRLLTVQKQVIEIDKKLEKIMQNSDVDVIKEDLSKLRTTISKNITTQPEKARVGYKSEGFWHRVVSLFKSFSRKVIGQ